MDELTFPFPKKTGTLSIDGYESFFSSIAFTEKLQKFCVDMAVPSYRILWATQAFLIHRYLSVSNLKFGITESSCILNVHFHKDHSFLEYLALFQKQLTDHQVSKTSGLSFAVSQQNDSHDLCFYCASEKEKITLHWQYNLRYFSSENLQLISDNLLILIDKISNDPLGLIRRKSLLDKQTHLKLIDELNRTEQHYPEHSNIAEIFRQQSELFPQKIALSYKTERLTYKQLDWLSNQLASYLIEINVKPHDLVGVYLDRSFAMVVAFLAILKVGAGYLPLDRKYPLERLQYLINDAKIDKVISSKQYMDRLSSFSVKAIDIDSFLEIGKLVQESHFDIVSVDLDSVAYVNYTSGSTGNPKGVVIPHRGVIRLFKTEQVFRLDSDLITLQIASISFDALTFELWGPLLNGGQCAIFPYALTTAQWLKNTIYEQQINALFITASLFNALIDEEPDLFKPVRTILVGGEALSAKHMRRAYSYLEKAQLFNIYGPTECTTFSIAHLISQIDEESKTIPIGKPISNTAVFILDIMLNPVPIGVIGEIYISGPGLALGYLNQEELTREKFIQAPEGLEPYHRLYKTGDLAYFLPNGDIEFFGRVDNQVKLHGFRIELDEIDAVLRMLPAIENAVTLMLTQLEQKKLVSYIIPKAGSTVTLANINHFLKERLPGFMIPAQVYLLEALPLNDNGKIDRVALIKNTFSLQGCPA